MKKALHLMMALLLAFAGIANAQSYLVDFESGDLNQAQFVNDATYPWVVTSEDYSSGTYSMRSGNVGVSSSESCISVSIFFEVDGSISFDADCLGEGNSTFYDVCSFWIDGDLMFEHGADVSGWNNYSFPVPAGPHTFMWKYTKDTSVNPAGDAFYVDEITFNGASSGDPFPVYVDFETGDFSQCSFYNDPLWPWEVTNSGAYEGTYCMKASNTGTAYTVSSVQADVNYPVDGYVSFFAKCNGSADARCIFKIDGTQMFEYGDEVEGWKKYVFDVTSGLHLFEWIYDKTGSGASAVDCFFVDKINFNYGTPCGAPENVVVTTEGKNAHVTWDDNGSTYRLRYKKVSATSWYMVNDLTVAEYTIENLTDADYVVEVMADCEPGVWTSANFTIFTPVSTAHWYAYARYCLGGDPWENKYVTFTMQNLSSVSAATTDVVAFDVIAGAFANGYVWAYDPANYRLMKAPVSNSMHIVGDFVTAAEGFTSNFVIAFSFNPANGKMYVVEQGMSMNYILKCFELDHPTTVTTCGTIGFFVSGFAINKDGAAFAVEESTGDLYSINLTNASSSLIGNTGVSPMMSNNSMSFDMVTGELFWAASTALYPALYCVNTTTGHASYVGELGSMGTELTSLFMVYDYDAVAEDNTKTVNVYPNPANDMLYIDGVDGELVRVYDNMGRMLMETLYHGHLDIRGFAQGIYAVSVGNSVVKFVKE